MGTRSVSVAEATLAGDVLNELRTRAWTGNVRELRNVIERAAIVARGQPIRPDHLPAAAAKPDLATPSQALEIQGLLAAWAERAFRDQSSPPDTTLYEQFLQLAEPPVLRALLEKCGQRGFLRREPTWTATGKFKCDTLATSMATTEFNQPLQMDRPRKWKWRTVA